MLTTQQTTVKSFSRNELRVLKRRHICAFINIRNPCLRKVTEEPVWKTGILKNVLTIPPLGWVSSLRFWSTAPGWEMQHQSRFLASWPCRLLRTCPHNPNWHKPVPSYLSRCYHLSYQKESSGFYTDPLLSLSQAWSQGKILSATEGSQFSPERGFSFNGLLKFLSLTVHLYH